MLLKNKKNSKFTDSRRITIKNNTPLIDDVINIINDYMKLDLDQKQIERSQIFDMNAASSYSFFKSTLKRGNQEWGAALGYKLWWGLGPLSVPLFLTAPVTYYIPILLKACIKTATRKPTYLGEDIAFGLENLKNLDVVHFDTFINHFIKIARTLPTHNNFIYSVKKAFIYHLEDASTPLDKLEVIEQYLKQPSNSQSRLYQLLVDKLIEIPDNSNVSKLSAKLIK